MARGRSRAFQIFRSAWFIYPALCSPLAFVFIPMLRGDVEYLADPAKYLLEYMGKTATILFILTLAVTPLLQLFPSSGFVKTMTARRRQLGVSVFVYALLHFLLYLPYVGSWEAFVADWDKLFILSGLIALVLLLVLAATSNNRSLRLLGRRRWKRLHWLVYAVLALVMYHQAAQEKTGFRETIAYFSPLLLLEGIRVARWWRLSNKKSESESP